MHQELLKSREIRFVLPAQEPCAPQSMDGTMNLGGAQPKITSNDGHGWALAGIGTELQRDDHVLGL
jgi:hypothetical protein